MIKLLLLFLLPFSLYASKILSYNIYDRTDRVDVMITFDTPYEGTIKESKINKTIVIKLEDASIESSKLKKLSSKYITSLSITPMLNYTQIVAYVPDFVTLKASKTSDGYGLRLRFSNNVTYKRQDNTIQTSTKPLSALPTKKTTEISTSYYIVVGLLLLGIIVLFFIRKKIPNANKSNSPWLFKPNQQQPDQTNNTPIKKTTENNKSDDENVKIRFQKRLNEDNSVVMLDFGEQSYLVLMGRNNILLDKFTDNKPTTQSDFESILQNRHQELENFLNGEDTNNEDNNKKLESYTNKASYISYEV